MVSELVTCIMFEGVREDKRGRGGGNERGDGGSAFSGGAERPGAAQKRKHDDGGSSN